MPTSSSTARGASGKKNPFTLTKGFPYLILFPEQFSFASGDTFILKSSDGGYEASTTFAQADVNEYLCVLWFPTPPEGERYSLEVKPESGDPFYWFEDEPLFVQGEAKLYRESQKGLRTS